MAIFPGSAIPSAVSDYEIDNSLRFDDGDSAYLSRTPSAQGSLRKMTFSVWVKKTENTGGTTFQWILHSGEADGDPAFGIGFRGDSLVVIDLESSYKIQLYSTPVYRDPSSWYHVCIGIDTEQGVAANRVKCYINGVQVTVFSTETYPAEDADLGGINKTTFAMEIGRDNYGGGAAFWDGYLAEAYFIDGTQLAPSSFGELDSDTNQWKPLDSDTVKAAVTFGTNGFFQKYNSTELATSFADAVKYTATSITATGSSTWTCPAGVSSAHILVVAGGGGGSANNAGGGGGGGVVEHTSYAVTAGVVYDITVGAGGAGGSSAAGSVGSNSVFNVNAEGSGATMTANGGGGGGYGLSDATAGGSGGGAGSNGGNATGAASNQSDSGGGTGYGNAGGNSWHSDPEYNGGGGGGASAAGQNAASGYAGDGGNGHTSTVSGSSAVYGGGGGAGATNHTPGDGGTGGGGDGKGAGSAPGVDGDPGTVNTGGGGGGGSAYGGDGGDGGSGIVIIKYLDSSGTISGHTITANGDVKNVRGADLDTTYDVIDTFTTVESTTWTAPAGITSVSYLVVGGGGGGGGGYYCPGGGAGGFRTGTLTVTPESSYTVTVGAGGAGGAGHANSGSDGSDSVFSSITSDGGGGGGHYTGQSDPSSSDPSWGSDGGSGGGGAGSGSVDVEGGEGGSPTSGQGYAGGVGNYRSGGGGGGASAVGGNGSLTDANGIGGNGGAGTASSITGSSVTYAGGGGGGGSNNSTTAGTGGSGGSGGGGNGASGQTATAGNGTANTGGGGGGASFDTGSYANGGSGGSGIVVISYTLEKPGSSSIEFDGTGDYLSVPHTTEFNWAAANFTVECWARFNSLPSGTTYGILNNLTGSGSGAGGTGWQMDLEDDSGYKLRWQFWDTGGSSRTNHQSFTPTLNQWYHIAVVRNSDVFTTYIDGTSIGATTLAYTIKDYASAGGAEFIGANRDNSYNANNYLPGYLDEIRYSDTARYTTTFTPQRTQFTADANTKLLIHSDFNGGLGADSSGNKNDFTPTNLVATDQMIDTPTNNFPTWNPLCYSPYLTFSEGNLKNVGSSASNQGNTIFSISPPTTGKWYFEFVCPVIGSGYPFTGTVDATVYEKVGTWKDAAGDPGDMTGSNGGWRITTGGAYETDGGGDSSGGQVPGTSDILQYALDHDNGALYYGINNTWYTPTASGGDPTSGASKTGAVMTWTAGTRSFIPAVGNYNTHSIIMNAGQDSSFAGTKTSGSAAAQDANGKGDFYYAPPTDYLALCTDNISAPEIKLPGENFNTVLYTGTGSELAVTGVGFQPDLTIIRARQLAYNNRAFDSVRGVTKELYTNTSGAEVTDTESLKSFDSDGFTLGDSSGVNPSSSSNMVSWNWYAPTSVSGSTVSSGTAKTYSGKANADAGFSITKYVGNGTNYHWVPHSLGVTPECAIVRKYGGGASEQWPVLAWSFTSDIYQTFKLDNNAAQTNAGSGGATNAAPDSTYVKFGGDDYVNSNGVDMLMYCFASIEGYSKVGSYTGNSNTDGSFIYTGFSPGFVILKTINGTGNWNTLDNKRDPYNVVKDYIYLNATDVNTPATSLDFLSNGFKLRINDSYWNDSSYEYLYIAFAESPFKTSNAR